MMQVRVSLCSKIRPLYSRAREHKPVFKACNLHFVYNPSMSLFNSENYSLILTVETLVICRCDLDQPQLLSTLFCDILLGVHKSSVCYCYMYIHVCTYGIYIHVTFL